MLDAVTSVLELAVAGCVVAALVVAAVVLGDPWGWPVGLVAAAVVLGLVRAALRTLGGPVGPR